MMVVWAGRQADWFNSLSTGVLESLVDQQGARLVRDPHAPPRMSTTERDPRTPPPPPPPTSSIIHSFQAQLENRGAGGGEGRGWRGLHVALRIAISHTFLNCGLGFHCS